MARSFLTGAAFAVAMLTAPQFAQAAQSGWVGLPAAAQTVSFSVHLPLRNEAGLDQLLQLQSDPRSPLFQHFLTVAQFRANFGPSAQTIARAAASLRAHGLAVVSQSSQTLRVSGAASNVERAFATKLGIMREGAGARVAAAVPVSVPADLAVLGATVTGLEAHSYRHLHSRQVPLGRYGANGLYWFDDLKQAYTYPSNQTVNGKNAVVGIVMASDVLDSDTAAYFKYERYTAISGKQPLPLIRVPINGGTPFDPNNGASFEASIDVQTSQGSAPGAQIELFNIPSLSDQDVFTAYITIDEGTTPDGTPILQPDVVSSSFGECELFYTAAYNNGKDHTGILRAYHELFAQGNAEGITFVASSGDNSGLGCTTPSYLTGSPTAHFIPGVESPASDPDVTGVGGTNLETTVPASPQPLPTAPPSNKGLRSKYVSENEYPDTLLPYDPYGVGFNASGGLWGSGSGASTLSHKPWYQYLISTPSAYRAVPDISMQMGGCPGVISAACNKGDSASLYFVGGSIGGFIGTSLSAPEFAGLLAVKVGATGKRLGNANGYIYRVAAADAALPSGFPAHYFHQGIPGFNGVVTTSGGGRGHSPIVGVGTPYTQNFLGLPSLPLAGDPQTISNP